MASYISVKEKARTVIKNKLLDLGFTIETFSISGLEADIVISENVTQTQLDNWVETNIPDYLKTRLDFTVTEVI